MVHGTVTDAATGESLPGVHVYYQEDKHSLTKTNTSGRYRIPFRKGHLVFSMVGFDTQIVSVAQAQKLNVKMSDSNLSLREVEVSTKRKKYERKDNPAVLLMQKVINAKRRSDLKQHDYYSFLRYEKMVTALNEFTPKVFEDQHFKRLPFLREYVDTCPETGKLILPLIMEERVSRQIYRKSTDTEKTIVLGQTNKGINEFMNTGDFVTSMLDDCFTDVDVYDDNIRLLQFPFISPIATKGAISFYRYFLGDTVVVGKDPCIQVNFAPNNHQDFGFSGTLWVLADSTYRLRRIHLGIPQRSDINFVEHMDIIQEFDSLPTGEQVRISDKMIIQLRLTDWIQKAQVERTVRQSQFDFYPIPDQTFRFGGQKKEDSQSRMRDEAFWQEHRSEPLTHTERHMDHFMQKIQDVRGFKPFLWIFKAFVDNYVETSLNPDRPSKVDIGPVNSMLSSNFVEGFKLRASAMTTAHLSPHLFARGYLGYGFADKRWKGLAELTYSFRERNYTPREFPANNLTASFFYDVIAPSDRFLQTDKDNVFTSLKWTTVDHMSYVQRFLLQYDREWDNGLRLTLTGKRERTEGAGKLFYQPLHAHTTSQLTPWGNTPELGYASELRYLTTADLTARIEFQPGASWVNTKQRRRKTNKDAPIYVVSHTAGFRGILGGDYRYNLTELSFFKRFWLRTWGRVDLNAKVQHQWNSVPFPLLCFPVSNLSYIKTDNAFHLINNMEFITDNNASLHLSWDLNGKLFNRIPLLNRLKWRERIGCNLFWGYLSHKNNPALHPSDARLFYFPGHYAPDGSFTYTSQPLRASEPYVELTAGIHNIFKFFSVDYVHRLNYLRQGTQKWGLRFRFEFSF
ncbi:MAG: carboxypeptidase-like regulatory domain-containing protein [Bacteroidales bacterium]|nr:carboxypeptidase-like regulatory domain-containing protein [Candidatus Physcousia equi]